MSAAQSLTERDGRWWPSRFGTDDQLGMLNHIGDAKRAAAMSLVREGRLYDLGRVLDENAPVFPGRYFRQTLVTTAHHANVAMPVGENHVNWVTEIVSGTMQLFHSSSAVNPALTAMANALRVGDHLLERLGASAKRVVEEPIAV